jgi:acyl-coenzyme A thioesterase PaaI-like protein
MKGTLQELAHIVANADFLRSFGFLVRSCAPRECTLVVPYSTSMERPAGIVTGIALMGAADVAMWLATRFQFGAIVII